MYKKIALVCLVIVIFLQSMFSVNAESYDSYTHIENVDGSNSVYLSREVFKPEIKLTADSFGLDSAFDGITDIYTQADKSVLLLCGGESKLYKLDAQLKNAQEIFIVDEKGSAVNFKGAQGVSFNNEKIYIADTLNSRILVCNDDGKLIETMLMPESDLIPKDFLYQPFRVAFDTRGYIYILSQGCYYGAMLYSPQKEFLGFYGANTVKSGALDTLNYLWDKLTSTEEKKASSVKTLPYSFVDFCFDSEDYMIVCNGMHDTTKNESGQIRKISSNGSDILYRRNVRGGYTLSNVINFLEEEVVLYELYSNKGKAQNIVSIDTDENGNMYTLDMTNGTIYVYDSECNLLSAFGGGLGIGNQLGVFKVPNALTIQGSNVLVTDSSGKSITVFKVTDFGKLLFNAQSSYLKGDYEKAKPLWEQVLANDRNSQLAYRGLAISYYNEGKYEEAKDYAEKALDYTVYDLAWQAIISEFISDYFVVLLLGVILLIALIVYLIIFLRKKIKLKEKTRLFFQVPIHPFKCFEDLKYKKLASMKIAIIVTGLFFIVNAFKETTSGFLFTYSDVSNYNIIYTFASTVGLIVLWSICNYLVSSMFSGKGTLKEVYVFTTYSLVPLIAFTFIKTIVTNFAALSMEGLLNGLEIAILIYTFFLLAIAIMQAHQYDFFKFLSTSLVTIFFMLLVVFVLFLCAILLKQCGSFIVLIYEEIAFR